MGNRGKNHQTSSPSRSRKPLPSTLGPFILEEASASCSLSPRSLTTRSTAAMSGLPVPAPAPAPAPAAAGHAGARPEKAERIKGFITKMTGSQSAAQLQLHHSKKSQQPTYGPVLPLTEDLVKRLMGTARKSMFRTSSSHTLASNGKLTSFRRPVTPKEKHFETKLALRTRYNEPEDNRFLAESYLVSATRREPTQIFCQQNDVLAAKIILTLCHAATSHSTLPHPCGFSRRNTSDLLRLEGPSL